MKQVNQSARLPLLLVVTAFAAAFGVASDFVWDGISPNAVDVIGSFVLSPIVVTVGGGVVDGPFRDFFIFGGLLFWPLYALLAWRWLRTGRILVLVAAALWSLQGFFLILNRLALVMSV